MRFPLPIAVLLSIALAGCSGMPLLPMSKQKKLARERQKAEQQEQQEDSRTTEQRRMLAIQNRFVDSERGAEVFMPDKHKKFDANQATASASHGYSTGKAQTKSFYSDRPVRMDAFQTRDFYGSKTNQAAQRTYGTGDANTKGKYLIPNAGTTAATKPADTKQAWDANKAAPSRDLADGRRQYLGPESKKLGQPVNAKDLANWRNGGEAIIYTDHTVERVSNLKDLSIEDIRDLLNKSK